MLFIACFISLWTSGSFALENTTSLSTLIQQNLREKIPNAEIKLPVLDSLLENSKISAIQEVRSVSLVEEQANGMALFEITGNQGEKVKIQTPFQALMNVPVAARKIYPKTKLKKEDFSMATIDASRGSNRVYRGSIMTNLDGLMNMETKQTILAGQFVVSSAVQKQPDVRAGETIKLELRAGNLSLTTSALVRENGSVGERIHVTTTQTKKELVGKILEDKTIEVSL